MIAVDTNLLVYAHREDSAWHKPAFAWLAGIAEGTAPWAIPWPCIHEFLAIVTHPRIYLPPTPMAKALKQVDAWREAPGVTLLAEGDQYWDVLREVAGSGKVVGPQVHDARIAALCLHHGVEALCTADRDFGRFPALTVRNPLVS